MSESQEMLIGSYVADESDRFYLNAREMLYDFREFNKRSKRRYRSYPQDLGKEMSRWQ